jgi:hypothetical protein
MQPDPSVRLLHIELLKVDILESIGQLMLNGEELTDHRAKNGLQYLENSRKLREANGYESDACWIEAQIVLFKAQCIDRFVAREAFGSPETQEQLLQKHQNAYKIAVEKLLKILENVLLSSRAQF